MGVLESKTQSSPSDQNLAKGPRQDGSNGRNNMLLTKSNNGTAVESNNKREENKQTGYELEHLENTKLDSSCVRALEHESSQNVVTQMNCEGIQLAKVTNPRRSTKQGETAEIKTGGMHNNPEEPKTDGRGNLWGKSIAKGGNTNYL
eukprot:8369778-Ditylum_brightwellii.AAC.1